MAKFRLDSVSKLEEVRWYGRRTAEQKSKFVFDQRAAGSLKTNAQLWEDCRVCFDAAVNSLRADGTPELNISALRSRYSQIIVGHLAK